MSLYGDIAVVPGEKAPPTPSSSIRLLQDHLRLKNRDRNRQTDRHRTHHHPGTRVTGESVLLPAIRPFGEVVESTGSLLGGEWDVGQEYDPFKPNEYEKVVRDRREQRKKTEQIQVTAKKRLVGPYTSDDEDEDEGDGESATAVKSPVASVTENKRTGAAIPPPKDLTSSSSSSSAAASDLPVLSPAAKIMQKMGYREGSGLGKEEQGMSKPLTVEKVGVREGKILTHDQQQQQESKPVPSDHESKEKITQMLKTPTKVVLLTNMVGAGEVDEDLEPETKDECGKYGLVDKCVIFENKSSVRDEDAVRIFVQFQRIESAIKAVVDLNGRFFGGRTVKASFYDVERFRNLDLMDK